MENNTDTTKEGFSKKLKENRLHPAVIVAICVATVLFCAGMGYGITKLIDIDDDDNLQGPRYEKYYKDLFEDQNVAQINTEEYSRDVNDGSYCITNDNNYTEYQLCADYNKDAKLLNIECVLYNLSDEYMRFQDSTDLLAVASLVFINGEEAGTNMSLNYSGEFQVLLQHTGTFTNINKNDKVEVVVFDSWNRVIIREKIDLKIAETNFDIGKTPYNFYNMNTGSYNDYTGYFFGRYYGDNNPDKEWYLYDEAGGYYCEPGYLYDRLYGAGYPDEYYEASEDDDSNYTDNNSSETTLPFPCVGTYSNGYYSLYLEDRGNGVLYISFVGDSLSYDGTASYDPSDPYEVYFDVDTVGTYEILTYKENYSLFLTDPSGNSMTFFIVN